MAIAFTNKRKALNLLKEVGFDTAEIEKGSAKGFDLDAGKLKSIAEGEKNNIFEVLNKAGKLLRDSMLTRSTGHKENDFSSVQSASALALEKLYMSLENSIDDTINNDEFLSDEQKKIVKKKLAKIWVTLRGSLREIGASDELKKIVEDEMNKTESDIKADFKKIFDDVELNKRSDGLPAPTVAEVEAAKSKVEQDAKNYCETGSLGWMVWPGVLSHVILKIMVATGTPLLTAGFMCGGAFGIVATIGLGIAITGLVINANQESFEKIKIKKRIMRIQGILTNVLRQINELNRTVKQMRKDNLKEQVKDETELPAEIMKKIKDFVEAQEKLWSKYATAAARNYEHKKDSTNKHKSAGKMVSDEKTSGIGKAKQGLACQWCQLRIK